MNSFTRLFVGGSVLLLLTACIGGGGDSGGAAVAPTSAASLAAINNVTPTSVTIQGTYPATTGVPAVLVNGSPATLKGQEWSCTVAGTTQTATVQFLSDGEVIATKEISVSVR